MQGYFPFNGNANDESSYNNNGVVYNATLTTDRFGNLNSAYEFDGIDNYIHVPFDYSYSEMSITGWFYPYTSPQEGPVIFKIKDLYDDWGLFYRNGAHLLNDIGNDNQQLYNTTVSYNWHFFTIILTNSNENKMYIDNVMVGSGSYSSNDLTSFIGDLFIGQRNSTVGYDYFNGKIDDIGIYDKALNPTEVDSIYNYTTQVDEFNIENSFTIYPNPSTGIFYMDIMKLKGNDISIKLCDVTGKLVTNYTYHISANRAELNIKNIDNGIYFVTLIDKDVVIGTGKIIKQE